MRAAAQRFLHSEGGFTLPAPVKMHPSEISLTLSADVLRLPITMNARAVLAEIVSLHAANAGCCDASDAHFAARLTLNKDTVSVAVQLLETQGLVSKVTTLTPSGKYRKLIPNLAAITAKAASNPYPEVQPSANRKFRSGQAGNSGQAKPEIPVMLAGNSGYPKPEKPESLTGISGGNIPDNTTENLHYPNEAASAAAAGSEKKIGAEFSSAEPSAEVEISAPPVAAAPPAKLHLMRLSPVATFPAFAQAWEAAALANPDTYADYTAADLLHYHTALLDWSNSNGKKKLDWLATIRASMRRDNDAGTLRRLGVKPGATPAATSQVSQRQANSNALRARYQPK